MRLADIVAKRAGQFQSKVLLIRDNDRVDGKSIIDMLGLGAAKGTKLVIEAVGPDADLALEAIASLFLTEFADDEENRSDAGES